MQRVRRNAAVGVIHSTDDLHENFLTLGLRPEAGRKIVKWCIGARAACPSMMWGTLFQLALLIAVRLAGWSTGSSQAA